MNEIRGNIWDYHKDGNWVAITTNGFVKKGGRAVMGRGTALQASNKFPSLAYALGGRILDGGNRVFSFPSYNLLTFPVKHAWFDTQADPELIGISVSQLLELWKGNNTPVYLPRPGCGNGGLRWGNVRPLLLRLDPRFTIVSLT